MSGNENADFAELLEGMSFKEESSGTNAVVLSMKLKKEVYTLPQDHYCAFLGKKHIYSKPLLLNSDVLAYLVLSTQNQPIKKELLAVSKLLDHCMKSELISGREKPQIQSTLGYASLSDKQLEALLLFSCGMTDKAAAIEMNVCFDTIKYHKKNIFKKLDATCTVQAVVKAIKQNIISVDQIKV